LSLIPSILAVALFLAVLALLAYRGERRKVDIKGVQTTLDHPVALTHDEADLEAHGARLSSSGSLAALGIDKESDGPRTPVPFLAAAGGKVCKECQREFQTVLTRCPFDHSRLVPKPDALSNPSREDYLDTRRAVMRCDACRSAFDVGANFCIYDGEELARVEEEDARAYFDGDMVCAECDRVFDRDTFFCPDDGSRLRPVLQSETHAAYGSVPLVICPACATEYPLGTATCEDDGHQLLPLLGRTTGARPLNGFGRKTRICTDCGGHYAEEASYCAIDRTELISLN
jgi:hypothetical protein